MRALLLVLFLGGVAYACWPYYELMRLDRAVVHNDETALAELVDIDAVRQTVEATWSPTGNESASGLAQGFAEGMQVLSSEVVARMVTLPWFRETLLEKIGGAGAQGLWPGVNFACFEGPTRFLVRYGQLGEKPVHLYLDLSIKDRGWRVSAIYP